MRGKAIPPMVERGSGGRKALAYPEEHTVKVLELGARAFWAGKLLSEQGAEVIKIEPIGGSVERRIGPFLNDVPHPETSVYFWHYNTDKRSLTLNLETEEGRDILRRLISKVDVLLDGFAAGYLKGIGIKYGDLMKANPRLIICSISDFGQTGPWRDFKADNLVHMCLGGQVGTCGYDDPTISGVCGDEVPHAYHIAGAMAVKGILAALFERVRSGKGQYIDVPIHSSASTETELALAAWEHVGMVVLRQTGRHAMPIQGTWWATEAGDGGYILALAITFNDAQWAKLVSLFKADGIEEDLEDEKYKDAKTRMQAETHWRKILKKFCAMHDSMWLTNIGQQIGLPWFQIREPCENLTDPHFRDDRGYFPEVYYPELGCGFRDIASTYNSTECDSGPWQRAPLIGEHNEEVLAKYLGYTEEEVSTLHAGGTI